MEATVNFVQSKIEEEVPAEKKAKTEGIIKQSVIKTRKEFENDFKSYFKEGEYYFTVGKDANLDAYEDLVRSYMESPSKEKVHQRLEVATILKIPSEIASCLMVLKNLPEEEFSLEAADIVMYSLIDNPPKESDEEAIKKKCRNRLIHFVNDLDNEEMRKILLKLKWKSVVAILTHPKLRAYSENTAFQCVRQWVLTDPATRKEFSHLVLHSVRFPLLSSEYLMCIVTNNDVFNYVAAEHQGQFIGILAHAMFYMKADGDLQSQMRESSQQNDYRRIYMIPRPEMGTEKRKWVHFNFESELPTDSEKRSQNFLLHGYFMYVNIRREPNKDDSIAITVHIDSKSTGSKNPAHQMSPFHYKLYLQNLESKAREWVGVGVVDHLWTKENGWGKSLKIPGEPYVVKNRLRLKIVASIGKCPFPVNTPISNLKNEEVPLGEEENTTPKSNPLGANSSSFAVQDDV